MTRRAHKVDGNQAEIVKALRRIGASVQILSSVGRGCPDILVGLRTGGNGRRNLLMEIKLPGERFTLDQVDWHDAWRGQVAVVETVDEALKIARAR